MSLVLPKKSAVVEETRYRSLGLRDLPFPTAPVVDPYNYDPRRNGSIYADSTARAAIDKFESLLIRPGDFRNRVRLAYLWSKGDSESGRGVGKTALLRYFRHRINKDYGASEFGGQFSAVVVYVSFPSQVDRRYMEQLAISALVDICKSGVLDSSRAALRLAAMSEEQGKAVLNGGAAGIEEPANLLKDEILKSVGVSPEKLDDQVTETLVSEGISRGVAQALARGQFEDYLRSMRKDGNLEPFYVPRDTKILDYSRSLLFNAIVDYLRCAGFAGGYLFVDDIENLVDQMTRRNRIEFAKEFALCTVRPGTSNAAHNFFSCVLTTHQQASVGLSHAWGEAGLSTIARLDPGSTNSVELPFPSREQAKDILVAHIDYYRIDTAEKGSIRPFTQDGIDALLEDRELAHPRDLLRRASLVFLHAADKHLASVDADCVRAASQTSAIPETPNLTEGIDQAI